MNNKHCCEFSAGIRVMRAAKYHEQIFKRTGIKATEMHKKGDIRNMKSKHNPVWRNDIWCLTSPLNKKEELTKHINWIKKKILPHSDYFRSLISKGVKIDIFCSFTAHSDITGFSIKSEALEILTKLGINLEISIITN